MKEIVDNVLQPPIFSKFYFHKQISELHEQYLTQRILSTFTKKAFYVHGANKLCQLYYLLRSRIKLNIDENYRFVESLS